MLFLLCADFCPVFQQLRDTARASYARACATARLDCAYSSCRTGSTRLCADRTAMVCSAVTNADSLRAGCWRTECVVRRKRRRSRSAPPCAQCCAGDAHEMGTAVDSGCSENAQLMYELPSYGRVTSATEVQSTPAPLAVQALYFRLVLQPKSSVAMARGQNEVKPTLRLCGQQLVLGRLCASQPLSVVRHEHLI